MLLLVLLSGLLAVCLAASTSSANATASATLKTPSALAVGEVSRSFRDAALPARTGVAAGSRAQLAEWGGPTVASDGETVTIYFSSSYPVDQALQLKWADFLTSLVHGTEISTVTIHLAPLSEVQRYCGAAALACYSDTTRTIFAPGDNPAPDTSAEGALAHEYGHHVAASRLNPPFASIDYGTKRWASYENVCSKATNGTLYPGAEDREHYMLNPGEAFAESYRVLNEQKLGIGVEPWDIVTTSLYPDATALGLLEQDVVAPWAQNTAQQLTARLTRKAPAKTFVVSTPLDGTLTVAPRKSGSATVKMSLLAGKKTIGTSAFKGERGRAVTTTVCGQRSYTVRVSLAGTVTKSTKATVSVAVSSPSS
jgi:hypothetical protein